MGNQEQEESDDHHHNSEVEEEHPNAVLVHSELPCELEREDRVD